MTPGFYSTPLWRHDLLDAARLIAGAGYADIEINGDDFGSRSMAHLRLPLSTIDAAALAADIRTLGLAIPALSANRHLVMDGPAGTAAAKAHIRGMIDVAAAMSVPFVHVFTGRGPDGADPATLRPRLTEALAELVDHATGRGVAFGIEGCAPHLFPRTEDYLRLLGDLPGVPLKICFDPSHIVAWGEDPAVAVERFGDRIAHVHVKDAAGRFPDFSFPPLGRGTLDFPALLQALRRIGYAGSLTVEYEANGFGWNESEAHVLAHSRAFLRALGV